MAAKNETISILPKNIPFRDDTSTPATRENKRTHQVEERERFWDRVQRAEGVYLWPALARKYPNAGKEWIWQYVFPAKSMAVDPRSGKVRRHHLNENLVQKAVKKAAVEAGINKKVGCRAACRRELQ